MGINYGATEQNLVKVVPYLQFKTRNYFHHPSERKLTRVPVTNDDLAEDKITQYFLRLLASEIIPCSQQQKRSNHLLR